MDTEPVETSPNQESHVVILHEKLAKSNIDKYIVNLALAYQQLGNKVTILTSEFETENSITEIRFSDKLSVEYSGRWIPKSCLGLFKDIFSAWKAACMACRLLFSPPEPKPDFVLLDGSLWALYLLKCFTNYKIFYIENFKELKTNEACFEYSRIIPTLLTAKWINLADEIIVQTVGFADILLKSYPFLTKQPRVFYPSVDLGLWKEPSANILRIIPNLMEDSVIFLTVGSFRRFSNFKLSMDAFELLLDIIDDKVSTTKFKLVLAGNCDTDEEMYYYNELMEVARQRYCANQIIFLKCLPTRYEKTLIMESAVIIHPAKNDTFSEFLLKAMYLGKPIIATNKGIASKILAHRLSGVIIDPEPKVFAVAMKKVIMSPHLQVFLGDMAKDAFEKSYSFNSLCERLSSMTKKVQDSSSSMYIMGD